MRASLLPTVFLAVLTGITAGPPLSQGADKHPFANDDYSALHSATPLTISPDSKTILYDVATDGLQGPTKHEYRLIDVNGANPRKLALPEKFQPAGFTKDGALFGTLQVDKLGQLAIVPLAGDKPTLIIALPNGIHSAAISPDGSRFVLLADSRAKDPLQDVHNVVENDETSLYVVGMDGSSGSWWCPDLKFVTDVAWSSDSSQIAVMTQLPKLGYHQVGAAAYVCGASGPHKLADIPNNTAGITWSSDRKEIVFASTTTPTLTPEHIWTVPAAGGAPADRTPQLAGTSCQRVLRSPPQSLGRNAQGRNHRGGCLRERQA